MSKTTEETPAIAAAREALLAAQTQGNRFEIIKAHEAFIDAKLEALSGGTNMVERKGPHPLEGKREEARRIRAAQDERIAQARAEEKAEEKRKKKEAKDAEDARIAALEEQSRIQKEESLLVQKALEEEARAQDKAKKDREKEAEEQVIRDEEREAKRRKEEEDRQKAEDEVKQAQEQVDEADRERERLTKEEKKPKRPQDLVSKV